MKTQHSILSLALSLFFFCAIISNGAQAQKLKSDATVSRTVSAGQIAADGRPRVVVTITIKKDAFKGPARIEEDFSGNFQAVLISSDQASFQNSNGKAEFIWNVLQEDRVVTVSYALEALGKTDDNQTVSGKFYYQNTTFDIAPSSFTIDASNLKPYVASAPSDLSTLDELYHDVTGDYPDGVNAPSSGSTSISSGTAMMNTTQPTQHQTAVTTPVQQAPAATTTPTITSTPIQQQTAATTTSTTASAPAMQQQTAVTTPPVVTSTPVQQQTAVTTTTVASTPAPAASGNDNSGQVIYRIQVVVVGDKARVSSFFRQYKITEQPVYESVTTGDTPARVMVGSYTDYNSAKARCEQLKGKGIKDAFIAPYYMGKRITFAEAASHTQH